MASPEQMQESILPSRTLNRLFEFGREVVFYAINDERMTIKEISESISTYGYSSDEFISGKIGWKDIVHPDDRNFFVESIHVGRTNDQMDKALEFRILTKANERVWVNCLYLTEMGANGKITHFLCKIRDISLRKIIEKKLNVYREELELLVKNSESKIRNFIQQSFEGIVILDREGHIIEWNKAMEQIVGLSREETLGKFEWEMMKTYFPKDETFDKLRQSIEDYIHGSSRQEPVVVEVVMQKLDSSVRYLQIYMFPISQTETCYFGHIVRDITEQKHAEMSLERYRAQLESVVEIQTRELRETQKQLISLNENLQGGIIFQMVDDSVRSGWFTHVSASFANIFEISVEEIMANPTLFYLCIYPDDRKRLMKAFIFTNEKRDMDIEFRILTPSDKTKWIQLCASHHITDEGAREWNGLMYDITDRKQAEFELIRAKEKAEESDKLKSSFLGNLSHEIRTPLNGIATLLDILGQDSELPDSIREYIDIINTNSEQLLRLINDIIDMAKIEAKQMEINPEPLCISDLMDEMYNSFGTNLQTRNKAHISLECLKDASAGNCTIQADPERLRQIVYNLLDNAVKFTEQGWIRFGYRLESDMLEFFVEDTGAGISKSQLENIFQWFRQAELENNRRYGGTGLGLTISRSLVQLMGGNMRVESTEGIGSSFFFTIPYLPVSP